MKIKKNHESKEAMYMVWFHRFLVKNRRWRHKLMSWSPPSSSRWPVAEGPYSGASRVLRQPSLTSLLILCRQPPPVGRTRARVLRRPEAVGGG